jgi:NADP-reducing hydrogenase subunit HndB
MGECAFEPLVEVVDLDGHSIIYCKVNKKMVEDIVESHIKNGKKLEKYSLYRFKK